MLVLLISKQRGIVCIFFVYCTIHLLTRQVDDNPATGPDKSTRKFLVDTRVVRPPTRRIAIFSDHRPTESQNFSNHPPAEFQSYAIICGGLTMPPTHRIAKNLEPPNRRIAIFSDHPTAEFFRGVVTP